MDNANYDFSVSYDGIETGNVSSGASVHDPSILKADNKYYIYGSHMSCASCEDLKTWRFVANGYRDSNTVFGQIYEVYDKAFAYAGSPDDSWTDYTFTVDAVKTSGSEGFLIPFSVGDKNNNWFWNIGGWNNTVSCLQKVSGGVKSDQISGTVRSFAVKKDTQYKLKIVVDGLNVKCYIDDELMIDHNIPETKAYEAYQSVSTDGSGDVIIKLVNRMDTAKTFAIDLQNAETLSSAADVETVAADSIAADNILGKPEAVTLKTSTVNGISDKFNYTVSPYSVTVIRVHRE